MTHRSVASLVLVGILGSASIASAQDIFLRPEDAHQRLIVVPPLVGAISADFWVLGRFALGSSRALPSPSFGGSLGWKHFMDAHGRRALRVYAFGDTGSTGSEKLHRAGLGTELTFRSFNRDFMYAGAGVIAEGALLFHDVPDDARTGYQVSLGAEVPFFGGLFSANPHLFGETGTSALVSYVDDVRATGWQVEARITVRLDWALKRGWD